MKAFIFILMLIAIIMIGINISMLDLNNPFEGESMIAVIGIVAAFCAILILAIFYQSKKIEQKINKKS